MTSSGMRAIKYTGAGGEDQTGPSTSIRSAFDDDEYVGHGFRIGDLVWGKVSSHPWWPGHIYNEEFASPAVRRNGPGGHVLLVAFFGDGSYGWFHPAELIPFEANFGEKSTQTAATTFVAAVEEAVDELSRRRSLGLACRCKNEYNLWPSDWKGYYVVDVGDSDPWLYSSSQISKARESFRPREMVSFVKGLALDPVNVEYGIVDLIENKATVLACRKALFVEFDDTYAQAFGSVPVRPPRPTEPVALDPSKATLSGRLVIAEALDKGETSVKPPKTKDHMERDRYLIKRREEPFQVKSKKASRPLLVYGSGYTKKMIHAGKRDFTDGRHRPTDTQASISPHESSRKFAEGGLKKAKVLKRPVEQLTAEIEKKVVKKKKNIIITEKTGVTPRQLPVAVGTTAIELDNVSRTPPPRSNNVLDCEKDTMVGPPPYRSQQEMDFARVELQRLVIDLRALALNPFHGEARSCPGVIKQTFLEYRSLVYQKSLVLHPPPIDANEAIEAKHNQLPAVPVSVTTDDNNRIVKKPSFRQDDSTIGGKKRGPSDRPEFIEKKSPEEIKRRKIEGCWDAKRKNINGSKPPVMAVKKILQRPSSERDSSNVRENAAKDLPPPVRKVLKPEPSKKRMENVRREKLNDPTMLVMKFPAGAALPSRPEVRARFARFGPLDHSAMRIFWKTNTIKLVYLHKINAQAALKFAMESGSLFGSSNVRCHIREVEVGPAEVSETPKKKASGDGAEVAVKIAAPPSQHPSPQQSPQSVNLKSCLKKPSGDEDGNGSGGRSAEVKFVLGGENEVMFDENKNKNQNTAAQLDIGSEVPKFINPKLQKVPVNMASSSSSSVQRQRLLPTPTKDISREMLNLLTRCNDVVNDVASVLGYMPYHPL